MTSTSSAVPNNLNAYKNFGEAEGQLPDCKIRLVTGEQASKVNNLSTRIWNHILSFCPPAEGSSAFKTCQLVSKISKTGWMNNIAIQRLLKNHYDYVDGIALSARQWRVLRASFRLGHCNSLVFDNLPIRSNQLQLFINTLCSDGELSSFITSISMNNCSHIQRVDCLKGLTSLKSAQFAWCKKLDVLNVVQSLPRVKDIDLRMSILALI